VIYLEYAEIRHRARRRYIWALCGFVAGALLGLCLMLALR
jgi:hypothetical protein